MANQLSKRIGKIHKALSLGAIYGGADLMDGPNPRKNVVDAMQAAGLDWDTLVAPVCLSDKLRTKIPGMFGTYRRKGPSLNIPFGTVRGRYRPMHNRESFQWLDNIMASKLDASIVSGGMIGEGKKVWMAVDIGGFEATKGDEIRKILLVMNSNDGSTHWSVHILPLRLASQVITNFHQTDGCYKIRHTRGADLKLAEIEAIMKAGGNLLKNFEASCKAMAKKKLDKATAENLIMDALGVPMDERDPSADFKKQPQWQNQVGAVMDLMETGPGCEFGKGTVWQVFCALQCYFDHVRTVRGSGKNTDNLYESKMIGFSAKEKVKAFMVCSNYTRTDI